MARADCISNKIADGIVNALRGINSNSAPDDWFTKPTVKRGFLMADLTGPFPVILVQLSRWGDDVPISGENHDGKVVFYVHCISENIENSEKGLNQLAADVIRAIAHDEALTSAAIEGFIDIYPKYYEPQTEAMEKIGRGITTVVVEATFQWSHDAP